MKNKIKILSSIGILMFLMSCSTTKPDLVEIVGKRKTENISNLENNRILNDKELESKVFDRKYRNVNKNLRGVWVSTAFNLDFPHTSPYNMQKQKEEIDEIIANTKKWGLNAIFLQVKPFDSVIYPSKEHPFDKSITGYKGADPGYDVLQYFITKAHENGIELHAWLNPYRATPTTDLSKVSSKNVANLHRDWVFSYGGKYYLNPAKREVVERLYKNIEEIVKNYDVDGLHLDDYFYPYPYNGEKLPEFDRKEFEAQNKYATIGDFRRANVDELIKNLSVSVHKIKPRISFGISPFGIYRNISSDERGSFTSGLQTYDTLYADVVKWMENGWIDYVAPQIYWKIGNKVADYATLVNWWSNISRKTDTPLYIGEGVFKEDTWPKDEVKRHGEFRKKTPNIDGYILFRYGVLKKNPSIVEDIR